MCGHDSLLWQLFDGQKTEMGNMPLKIRQCGRLNKPPVNFNQVGGLKCFGMELHYRGQKA
jgi:hypothetical protein